MRAIYDLLLSFNSLMLFGVCYSITTMNEFVDVIWPCAVFMVSVVLAAIILYFSRKLPKDVVAECQSVKVANDTYLPVYLGYFFVAFGIKNCLQFIMVSVFLFVFLTLSQIEYYNPLFLLFGYRFYFVINSRGVQLLILSKRKISSGNVKFMELRRINDYTYIDMER